MAESAPSPKTILRGHKAQVHAANFIRGNTRLVTGDAEGFVVLWDLSILRPAAVWRAHENAILDIRPWGDDKLISHGRDLKLIVWKLGLEDEEQLSTTLPVEDTPAPRPQPWILHLLEVNTLNFCSFAVCSGDGGQINEASEILVAVPNTMASEAIDVYTLPSQTRIHTIRPGDKSGMAMSLALFHLEGSLTLLAAFENGFATVHRLNTDGAWTMTYRSQAHTQPILSLDVHPSHEFFLTSSADSIIAKHPVPTSQQRILTERGSNERETKIVGPPAPSSRTSLLSAALHGSSARASSSSSQTMRREWSDPIKCINTKHSGQQSLRIRSDGRIFATAGWDSKIRVYSARTLKELAVLKWHQVGCYAVAFHDVLASSGAAESTRLLQDAPQSGLSQAVSSKTTSNMPTSNSSVKERRIHQAVRTHWVAAGAKDGKVSLWDVY